MSPVPSRLNRWWSTRRIRVRRRGLVTLGLVALIPLLARDEPPPPPSASDAQRLDGCGEPTDPLDELLWFAVDNPAIPRTSGELNLHSNQAGVVYYTTPELQGVSGHVRHGGGCACADEPLDYGSLEVLADLDLVDEVLAQGGMGFECGPSCTSLHGPGACPNPVRQGYVFETASQDRPEGERGACVDPTGTSRVSVGR